MVDIKKRRIKKTDWTFVEEQIKKELARRKQDTFRKNHERIWKEVDRMLRMEPMKRTKSDDGDWHNVIELGELARAQEIISADVRRLIFPTNRMWFDGHSELPPEVNEEGGSKVDANMQKFIDGSVRAFMTQQHMDFGFKARIDLAVHECLAHGSFVAEVREEAQLLVHKGASIQKMKAPVWVTHSMWNCYPDPSPHVLGANMFYNGDMIIEEFMPLAQLKIAARGDGWMAANISKVPKRKNKNKDVETEDIQLVKFWGDITIKRDDGDIYLPNSKVILANDIIVYYAENPLPFSPVIFNGYEKMDVRDPYYVSPIIKLAPMGKAASALTNKFLDAIDLKLEPPMVYDGNDPAFVMSGGPVIAPGAKTSTKGRAEHKPIETGDPAQALAGLTLFLDQLRQGTSVDAVRTGGGNEGESATGAKIKAARSEIRVVDFVDKLEFSIKVFLYMQHELNKRNLDKYSFYNPEMDAPDFMWMSKDKLPKNIHFEVVGARGVLGEEERSQKMTAVTMFASGNEMFAPLIKPIELLKDMYQDAGAKSPERFLKTEENQELKQFMEQAKQQMQEMQQQAQEKIDELEKELAIQQAVNAARVEEATLKARVQADISAFKAKNEAEMTVFKAEKAAELAEVKVDLEVKLKASELAMKEQFANLNKGPQEVKIIRETDV